MADQEFRYPANTFLVFTDSWKKKPQFHQVPLQRETVGFMEFQTQRWKAIIADTGFPEFRIKVSIIQKWPKNAEVQ